jgi:neutral ceramidase
MTSRRFHTLLFGTALLVSFPFASEAKSTPPGLRVGAAAVSFIADDSMEIAGSILPGKATGQEGELRAVAVVLEKKPHPKVAIVTCDILMITRDLLDPVVAAIEKTTGIPASNVLINCTHTHHAPSTVKVHGYGRDEAFCKEVQKKILEAVQKADANLAKEKEDCQFHFALGHEDTIGQNSRQMLADGAIYWTGERSDFVRPTGPFDPELPVFAFRDGAGKMLALMYNHSTHTIGVRAGGKRSPSFYGLAAQELEQDMGGVVSFLEGASGSTHNLFVPSLTAITKMKQSVSETLAKAQPRDVHRIAAMKQPFVFKVRQFDEASEDHAVTTYCQKRIPTRAEDTVKVFRNMRGELAPLQGQERITWIQVMVIGDVAIVGVPAEFFTKLGLDIKNRSPFRHTYIAELANDWIGYIPDQDAFKLGGYQVWTGFHSYAEPGTGERMVDAVVEMLKKTADEQP